MSTRNKSFKESIKNIPHELSLSNDICECNKIECAECEQRNIDAHEDECFCCADKIDDNELSKKIESWIKEFNK